MERLQLPPSWAALLYQVSIWIYAMKSIFSYLDHTRQSADSAGSVFFLKNVVFYTQSFDQVCKKHLKNGEKFALQAVSCNQSQKSAVFYMKAKRFYDDRRSSSGR